MPADYSPGNVAPVIDFFAPIIPAARCDMVMVYNSEVSVIHPLCQNIPYTPPVPPTTKSDAEIIYETYAKASARLLAYMLASPAHITYFQ